MKTGARKFLLQHMFAPILWGFQFFVIFPLNLLCYPYLTLIQLLLISLTALPAAGVFLALHTLLGVTPLIFCITPAVIIFLSTISAISCWLFPEGIECNELKDTSHIKHIALAYIFPFALSILSILVALYSMNFALGIFLYSWLLNNFLILYFIVIKQCREEDS